MITKEDIQNLANLARIEITPEEAEKMTSEMDSILGYVGQIQEATGNSERTVPALRNIMRDDIAVHAGGEYTEKILKNAPSVEGQYIKVKKIL